MWLQLKLQSPPYANVETNTANAKRCMYNVKNIVVNMILLKTNQYFVIQISIYLK